MSAAARRYAEAQRRPPHHPLLDRVGTMMEAHDKQRADQPGDRARCAHAHDVGRIAVERSCDAPLGADHEDQRKPAAADHRLEPHADEEQSEAVAHQMPGAGVQQGARAIRHHCPDPRTRSRLTAPNAISEWTLKLPSLSISNARRFSRAKMTISSTIRPAVSSGRSAIRLFSTSGPSSAGGPDSSAADGAAMAVGAAGLVAGRSIGRAIAGAAPRRPKVFVVIVHP